MTAQQCSHGAPKLRLGEAVRERAPAPISAATRAGTGSACESSRPARAGSSATSIAEAAAGLPVPGRRALPGRAPGSSSREVIGKPGPLQPSRNARLWQGSSCPRRSAAGARDASSGEGPQPRLPVEALGTCPKWDQSPVEAQGTGLGSKQPCVPANPAVTYPVMTLTWLTWKLIHANNPAIVWPAR